jgi:hypothetical protein
MAMDESTERFLALMEKQNATIAALAAEERERQAAIPPDQFRLQREQERREKWGQLRAREHPSRHPTRVRNIFPRIDLS